MGAIGGDWYRATAAVVPFCPRAVDDSACEFGRAGSGRSDLRIRGSVGRVAPISAVRGAIIEPLRSTQTGLRPTSIFTRPDPVAAIG
jgi:hypothetical protein